MLHVLKQKIGSEVFKKATKNYLTKHQFNNVGTSNFFDEIEKLTDFDLVEFVNIWIINRTFPFEDAIKMLKEQSTYIQEYEIIDCEANNSKCSDYLKYHASDDAKIKVIKQMPNLVNKATFKNSLKVRSAISKYVVKIPYNIKAQYESLLNDESYITKEQALLNLWQNFPAEQLKYLNKTKRIKFSDAKKFRILWLVLYINTRNANATLKEKAFEELIGYTDMEFNAETRISAFHYLNLMEACDNNCLTNLEKAKLHHNWRLTKFAKQLSEKIQNNKK